MSLAQPSVEELVAAFRNQRLEEHTAAVIKEQEAAAAKRQRELVHIQMLEPLLAEAKKVFRRLVAAGYMSTEPAISEHPFKDTPCILAFIKPPDGKATTIRLHTFCNPERKYSGTIEHYKHKGMKNLSETRDATEALVWLCQTVGALEAHCEIKGWLDAGEEP